MRYSLAIAVTLSLLLSKGSLAEERPLDLTFRGLTFRPQLMLEQMERNQEEQKTLSLDAKSKTLVLPAVQMRSGDRTVTLGIRPRKGGAEFRLHATWP